MKRLALLVAASASAYAAWFFYQSNGTQPDVPVSTAVPAADGHIDLRPRDDSPSGDAIEINFEGTMARLYADPQDQPGEIVDSRLVCAAKEFGRLTLQKGHLPHAAVEFITRSCGHWDPRIRWSYLKSDGKIPERDKHNALKRITKNGSSALRVGTALVNHDKTWIFVIAFTDRPHHIFGAPRVLEAGQSWQATVELGTPADKLSVLVQKPDGTLEDKAVELDDGRAMIETVLAQTGRYEIDMFINHAGDAEKLTQMVVYVGIRAPRQKSFSRPEPDEAETQEQAESFALFLLERDRERHGLDSLVIDERLTAIARAHSQDMLENGFFGHRSPNTGLPKDRFAAAGYWGGRGENLALDESLWEAQQGLYRSLGHRRNMKDPQATHVGIGVARAPNGSWYVTQLFSQPRHQYDGEDIMAAINAESTARDQDMDWVAQQALAAWRDTGDIKQAMTNSSSQLQAMRLSSPATVHAREIATLQDATRIIAGPQTVGVAAAQDQSNGYIRLVYITVK